MSGRTLMGWFREMLRKRPLITNTSVYATFYTAAEVSQQTFNKYFTLQKPDYDVKSAARVILVGSCTYAPVLYVWYKFLDTKLPGTSMKTVAAKVAAEQMIMTPILLATFFLILSVLEGKEDIFAEIREKYVKTFVANQSFWVPAQTINFSLVPPHMRVVYVACVSFMWINVLCFIKRQKPQTLE